MRKLYEINPLCVWVLIVGLLMVPSALVSAEGGNSVANETPAPDETSIEVDSLRVIIEGSPDKEGYYADMAKRLIFIQPGDPLRESAISESIQVLTRSNRFKSIHVDTTSTTDGETLVFTLVPHRYIKNIRIHGAYPLFEQDVLNQMALYPGDPFTQEDFSKPISAISERYIREGYIDPKVTISYQTDRDDNTVVIDVTIDKGPHYSLGNLALEGNHGISSLALKWRMHIWRASLVPRIGRFSTYRLKKDAETLLKYYREKRFADAAISYQVDDANHVNVTVTIREGPRYKVDIDGNQQFWNLTLKKDIVLSRVGNRSNIGVRKSIRNMTDRYRKAGFLDTQIQTEITDLEEGPAGTRHLRFIIDEGPQTIVNTLDITGNRTLPEEEIRKQILTRPPTTFHSGALVPDTLDEDIHAVTTFYANQGFHKQTVDADVLYNDDNTGADISLKIDEGPRTMVRTIDIRGLVEIPEINNADQVLVHTIGSPFRDATLKAEKQALTSLMAEQGYAHATVEPKLIYNDEKTRVDIVYDIHPGPRVSLGEIFIAGNLKTKEKVIRRELKVKPGDPLSLQNLHDGQRVLRDQTIFHGIRYRTIGLQEKKEEVNLFVDVEENKPYYFQFGGGYESDRGFFGRAKAGDRNVFGLNKDLWASGEVSQTGYRVETRLSEPRFFQTRTAASIGFFNEELTEFNQPFGTRTTGGSLGFSHEWGKALTTALSFSLEKRDQFDVESDPDSLYEEEVRTIFVVTPFIRYDTRDSFIRPTKGMYVSLGVDLSKGVENQIDDFFRYLVDTRYFLTPFNKLTFAGLARIGQVMPYSGSELVPDDQLFFLGGIRDVRGFKENLLRFDSMGNPVGGRTAIVGSLEARIDLGLNFELTTFFDVGSVQDALVDEGSEKFRPTIGVGLRYITPIGPMGFLYGHKLDREEGESAGRFHLSIGYSF